MLLSDPWLAEAVRQDAQRTRRGNGGGGQGRRPLDRGPGAAQGAGVVVCHVAFLLYFTVVVSLFMAFVPILSVVAFPLHQGGWDGAHGPTEASHLEAMSDRFVSPG